MATTVDERGRILLPKGVRDAHGLMPGRPVIIEETDEGVTIRAALPKEEVLERLRGIINEKTGRKGRRLDPLDLKRIWEPRV